MTTERPVEWLDVLAAAEAATSSPADSLQMIESVKVALQLAWATEGAVEAADAAGELWWLGLAETVAERAEELADLPQFFLPPQLGTGPVPGMRLADTPELRDAVGGLLAGVQRPVRVLARQIQLDVGGDALMELTKARTAPLRINLPEEAVAIAQARCRIYRTASRLTNRYIDARVAAGRPVPEVVFRMQADLAATVDATREVLELPGPSHMHGTAVTVTRAANFAAVAWDVLATDANLRGIDDASRWLTDAALLAAKVGLLDAQWVPALLAAAADPAMPSHIARILRWQVGPDIRTVNALGVADYPDAVAAAAEPTVPAATLPADPLGTPADAVGALEGYVGWLSSHVHDLQVPSDLAALAATAARLSQVAADHDPSLAEAARDAVQQWRRLHHVVEELLSDGGRPTGFGQPHRLAEWAVRQERPGARAVDRQVAMAIGRRLPELAAAAQASLQAAQGSWSVLTPAVERSGPHEVDIRTGPDGMSRNEAGPVRMGYRYSPADQSWIASVAEAFDAAGEATVTLASRFSPSSGQVEPADGTPQTTPHTAPVTDAARASTSHGDGDEVSRRADRAWVRWHIRRAGSGADQRGEPPGTRHEDHGTGRSAAAQSLVGALRAAAGESLAQAARNDAGWPALLAAAAAAHDRGHDVETLLSRAAGQREVDVLDGSVAGVLAGRIRRILLAEPVPAEATGRLRLLVDAERRATISAADRVDRVTSSSADRERVWRDQEPGRDPQPHRPDRDPGR